tara:strand:- start:17621 stop:18397 length:777 start_codon:yes stop_codon:yes gene_type:complete
MKKNIFIILLFFSFIVKPQSVSEDFDKDNHILFESGNKAFIDGNYQLAIKNYEKVLDNGFHSSALYYNLGNSFYRLNNVAETNYYFYKAIKLSPNDTDIQNNILYAQNMTLDSIEELPKTQVKQAIDYLISILSIKNLAFISLAMVYLFFIFFIFYLFSFKPVIKRMYFTLSLFAIIFGFLLVSLLYNEIDRLKNEKAGIVFTKELPVFSEPDKRNQESFYLHEGTKVQLLDKLAGWQKIRLLNGYEGWVKEGKVRSL